MDDAWDEIDGEVAGHVRPIQVCSEAQQATLPALLPARTFEIWVRHSMQAETQTPERATTNPTCLMLRSKYPVLIHFFEVTAIYASILINRSLNWLAVDVCSS